MQDQKQQSWRDILEPNYFGVWAIPGDGELEVYVEKAEVQKIETEDAGYVRTRPVLKFKGYDKVFPMNNTNCNIMEELTGSKFISDWVGSHLILYKTPTHYDGEDRMGVRVYPYFGGNQRPTSSESEHAEALEQFNKTGKDIYGSGWDSKSVELVSEFSRKRRMDISDPSGLPSNHLEKLTDLILEHATAPKNGTPETN